jgi:hypothetical protein
MSSLTRRRELSVMEAHYQSKEGKGAASMRGFCNLVTWQCDNFIDGRMWLTASLPFSWKQENFEDYKSPFSDTVLALLNIVTNKIAGRGFSGLLRARLYCAPDAGSPPA